MDVLYERCCGLDIHKKLVVACLITPGPKGEPHKEVRSFGTMTGDLLQLGDWLEEHGVTHVAMEATGVYVRRVRLTCRGCGHSWLPLQSVLGSGCHLQLSGFADPRPTVDRPCPFTPREYARLLLLRGRVKEGNATALLGPSTADAALVEPIVAPEPENAALGLIRPLSSESLQRTPWACPQWLRPYLALITGLRGEPVETLLNDRTADAESDPARAWLIDRVRAQVRLLEMLHTRGLLHTPSESALDLPE